MTPATALLTEHLTEINTHLQTTNDSEIHWEFEHRFHPTRKWRTDVFVRHTPTGITKHYIHQIAIEIEGGAWTRGRHTRGSGFIKDIEKYNALTILGIQLLRFTPQMVLNGTAKDTIQRVLLGPEGPRQESLPGEGE